MHTLVHLLEEAAAKYGPRPALMMEAGTRAEAWSYERLENAARAVAHHLRQAEGIESDQRLLVWAPNSPRLVATFFGAMMAKIVLVPLDANNPADFVARVAEKVDAAAIVVNADQKSPAPNLQAINIDSFPFDAEAPKIGGLPEPEEIAELVFTSGSTGDPKGVILTHKNITANVQALDGIIARGPHYRLLSLLPLSHMFEQTVGLYLPITYGATIHYPPGRMASALLRIMKERRITCLLVVPQVLELFFKAMEREVRQKGKEKQWQLAHRLAAYLPFPLRRLLFRDVHRSLGGHLDFFMCGGAYLAPSLAAAWERLGVKVVQGYGTTECSPVITCNTLEKRVLASVGRPLANVQLRIADDEEILVRGDSVFSGYWRNEQATAASFSDDGWYRTGDLGTLDSEGYLYLKGRKRDLIVLSSGLNVYPEDVENELKKEAVIQDCVVLGLPNRLGEIEVHAVVLAANQEEQADVRSRVEAAILVTNRRLALQQRIKGYTIWRGDDFPRTHTLKVKRHEVEARLADMAKEPGEQPKR